MSFSMQIGNTRLTNEVSNLIVTGSGATGPAGPAGLPGPTGPTGSGVAPNYPVSFIPEVGATGMLYSMENIAYWNFSIYLPPNNYSSMTGFYPISSYASIVSVLPDNYSKYLLYTNPSDNTIHVGLLNLSKTYVYLEQLIDLPSGGNMQINFSYQI